MNITIRPIPFSEDWEILWDCPEVAPCGYQRWFKTEDEAHRIGVRLRTEGCPNSPWFPDERAEHA